MKWRTVLRRLYQEKRIAVFTRSEEKNVQLHVEMKAGYWKTKNEIVLPVYVNPEFVKEPNLWREKGRMKFSVFNNVTILLIYTFSSKGPNAGKRFEIFTIVKLLQINIYLFSSLHGYIVVFRIATKHSGTLTPLPPSPLILQQRESNGESII
jgi:hypothetical protein